MTNVTFNTDDIAEKAGSIQTTSVEIESLLGTLTSQMAALAESYTGPGATAFQEVFEQWKSTQGQIKEELAEIGTALRNTGQVREDMEGQIAGQWASAL